ncbi:helix-turn-helix domain-containing protein [Patiriisocius marinus]|uniref:helix-turn-helix domain-containing protein n=1 Tax=Patiriisocius marinus TaxID=1397112 RepID=UPI00232A94C4|nr:helix-turn-helix domain-containing protein [Patiriisocius marinus]
MENPFELILNRLDAIENILKKLDNNFSDFRSTNYSPNFMTIDELSVYINLTRGSIYQHTWAKKIPHIKRGKKLYFEKSKIDEWMREGTQTTVSDLHKAADRYIQENIL